MKNDLQNTVYMYITSSKLRVYHIPRDRPASPAQHDIFRLKTTGLQPNKMQISVSRESKPRVFTDCIGGIRILPSRVS